MFTSIVGNVFGFKAHASRLEDLRILLLMLKLSGAAHGIQVERDKLNKYGRPLLGCTIKPKLGLSAKNYGRAVYECLSGRLDFTKDDENALLIYYCDDFIEKDRSRGIYFTQDWVSLPVLHFVAEGVFTFGICLLWTEIFGDDSALQFGGGTLGHPWGNAPGAVANRVALEACVQARNKGRDLAREGNEIIREACKWSLELATACEVWKEIKFEFEAMDTL
ncbi:hypothetical protein IFM89_030476 [Coptis chinensis]|uniref:Ribulose bisphosphate carboxylase large subunit C-terminal domain-containing protein n=1 Tax=Coptis chinensis TaxID=261450 RepID=A0A835H9V2_9MAGN|nr:hypothetical protein IFM89_030476 [Coptis chinensis]